MVTFRKDKKIDLVILCGGKGSRIKKLFPKIPKSMVKFENIEFIQLLINKYSKYNFSRIFILAGHKGDQIKKKYDQKVFNFIPAKVVIEKKLLGTGGALTVLKKYQVNNFLLVNGDTFLDINIKKFLKLNRKKSIGKIALFKSKNKEKMRYIGLGKNKTVLFNKKFKNINSGIYFFNKKIFKYLYKPSSLEDDIMPELINKNLIEGVFNNKFLFDFGTLKRFKDVRKKIKKKIIKPAAFLDRDGVINHDYKYVHNFKKFKFRNGVLNGLKFLIKKNYYIFIVTNQAGIAKKKFTLLNFNQLHLKLKEYLENKNIFIDDVQFCPHHPNAKIFKFRKKCKCRKPGNKMILNLTKKWPILYSKSFMIGDQLTDEKCAKKSGLYFEFSNSNFEKQAKSIIKKLN